MIAVTLAMACHLLENPSLRSCEEVGGCAATGTVTATTTPTPGTTGTPPGTTGTPPGTTGTTSPAPVDLDGDGWSPDDGDCDDQDPGAHPDAEERCGDGVDQDCDGEDPACPLQVAVTWSLDEVAAQDVADTLSLFAMETRAIQADSTDAAELATFDLVLVPPERTWDWSRAAADLEASGRPVLGMGMSGFDLYRVLGLAIGAPDRPYTVNENGIVPTDPFAPLYLAPYDFAGATAIAIVEDLWQTPVLEDPGPGSVEVWGRGLTADYAMVLATEGPYTFWAFEAPPSGLTDEGRELLVNVVTWAATQPTP